MFEGLQASSHSPALPAPTGSCAFIEGLDDESDVALACRALFDAHTRYAAIARQAGESDDDLSNAPAIETARALRQAAFNRVRTVRASSASSLRAKLCVLILLSTWFGFESADALQFAVEVAQETSSYLEAEGQPERTASPSGHVGRPAFLHWLERFSFPAFWEASRRSHH